MSTNLPFGMIDVENRSSADADGNGPLDEATNLSPTENVKSTRTYECEGRFDLGRDSDLWLYRERTIALLKRYLRFSIEVGRLPSILGRELFRSKVTSYRMSSFEDAVIFVHDVEQALDQLDALSKDLIAMIIFQDYSQDEAANTLRCARRTVCRLFPEAVDTISELFLEGGQLNRLPVRRAAENSCQEGESTRFSANACK